jgi:hypothetical protein
MCVKNNYGHWSCSRANCSFSTRRDGLYCGGCGEFWEVGCSSKPTIRGRWRGGKPAKEDTLTHAATSAGNFTRSNQGLGKGKGPGKFPGPDQSIGGNADTKISPVETQPPAEKVLPVAVQTILEACEAPEETANGAVVPTDICGLGTEALHRVNVTSIKTSIKLPGKDHISDISVAGNDTVKDIAGKSKNQLRQAAKENLQVTGSSGGPEPDTEAQYRDDVPSSMHGSYVQFSWIIHKMNMSPETARALWENTPGILDPRRRAASEQAIREAREALVCADRVLLFQTEGNYPSSSSVSQGQLIQAARSYVFGANAHVDIDTDMPSGS